MAYEIKRPPKAVILAAGSGSRLSRLTDSSLKTGLKSDPNTGPKCMLPVGGSMVLERMIRNCLSCGISQFVLVLGHRSDEIRRFVDKTFRGIRVTYVINDRYLDTNNGYSLMLASSAIGGAEFIKIDGDVVFDTKVLRTLVDTDLPNTLCIDPDAALAKEDRKVVVDEQGRVVEIGTSVISETVFGKPVGIDKISAVTGPLLFAELKQLMGSASVAQPHCEAAYEQLVKKGLPFHTLDITGSNWAKVDTTEGFEAAQAMFGSPIATVSRDQQRAFDEATEQEPHPT
jgi:choline kinase